MNAGSTLVTSVVLVPIIMGVVEALKRAGMRGTFAPLVVIALGVLAGLAQYAEGMQKDVVIAVIAGLGIGLSAAGLYSGSYAMYSGLKKPGDQAAPPVNRSG